MSLFVKTFKPGIFLRANRIVTVTQARKASHWLPDYVPGPTPKTEEERLQAAKKYNLLPEEYEAYPESEGFGDYPKLPVESVDSKDPWYPWDFPELRKDFNEPVNAKIIICLPEMLTTNRPNNLYKEALYCIGLCTFFGFLIYCASQLGVFQPIMEKQMPQEGVKHYTFDPDYSKAKH